MRLEHVEPDDVLDTDDGRRVVLVDQQVVVVSPMAAVLLDAVADGMTDVDDVTARLVEAFGAPPDTGDPRHIVEQIARDLGAQGVLSIVSAS